MRRFQTARHALTAFLLTGCLSGPVPADVPARIVDPTAASRAELQRVVSDALHVGTVTLAADALTDSSILVIERNRVRSVDNPPLSGRDLGVPHRFRLVRQGDRCVLVHDDSGQRFELTETDCAAL